MDGPITMKDFWMGRDVRWPPTEEMRKDAEEIVRRANLLLEAFGEFRTVRSGYRPPAVNAVTPGASLHSKHLTCQAIDIEDHDGSLDAWCLEHSSILASLGLWQESPKNTPTWAHVQSIAPASGHRVFMA